MENPTVVTPAAEYPLTAADIRQHIKFMETAEDGLINLFIQASTDYLESWLRRAFVQRTYRYYLDGFYDRAKLNPYEMAGEIWLPRPPLVSVSSIKYTDADGDEQTVSADDYIYDIYHEPGRVKPAPTAAWPAVQTGAYGSVRVEYVAGYPNAAAVPERYKQVLRWIVTKWFRNREGVAPVVLHEVPDSVSDFVEQLKVWRVG